ncbi:DUF2147 domain-containing protein [Rubrivivax sp. JA1024]|nr:DUF2147 domain-containing protein [Rubrivivax sp. JA1024]
MKTRRPIPLPALLAAAGAICCLGAHGASPDEARGRWLTSEKDGVIEFKACDDKPAALCGRIVWDIDAGGPKDNCGLLVAQFARWDNDAWREGWVFDPRDNKKYKGVLRVKDGDIHLRAYVGSEVLGQTEQMTRVDQLPEKPACTKR